MSSTTIYIVIAAVANLVLAVLGFIVALKPLVERWMQYGAMAIFFVVGVLGVICVIMAGISADRQQDAQQQKLDKIDKNQETVANDVSKIREKILGERGPITQVPATSSAQLPLSQSDHHPSVKVNGQPVGGKPAATATKEEVRIVEMRPIKSRYEDAPNGLEILLQTNVPLQPIYLNIKCSEPVQHVEVFPTEDFTGFFKYCAGIVPNKPNVAAISLADPAFVPEHAMIVRVYSKTENRVLGFTYQAGYPRRVNTP
jgi:hypothetical protein